MREGPDALEGTGSPARYPGIARARFAQAVLAFIAVFTTMDAGIVVLLIEPIKHEIGLTDIQVGLINTTVYYIAYGLLCMPMGMLADRWNRTRLLTCAATLWCFGLMLMGTAQGLVALILAKIVLGAASAITYPAALSLYSDYFPPSRRARATSTYILGQVAGQALAILVGGSGFAFIAAATASNPVLGLSPWRIMFILFAALGLLLIPALIALKEPARQEVVQRGGATFRELWVYRHVLTPLFAGMMFFTFASIGVVSWIAPALMRVYGQQPGDFATWLSLVQLAAGIAGVLAAGRLSEVAHRRGGRGSVMLPAALAAALCAPASWMATAPNLSWFAAGLFVFMTCSAVAMAIPVIAINFRIPNELRGLTMGLNVVLISLAGACAAPLVAAISHALGGDQMIGLAMALTSAPFALLAALCFWSATRSTEASHLSVAGESHIA